MRNIQYVSPEQRNAAKANFERQTAFLPMNTAHETQSEPAPSRNLCAVCLALAGVFVVACVAVVL